MRCETALSSSGLRQAGAVIPPSIEDFIHSPLLQQRLTDAFRRATRKKIIVGLQWRDQQRFAVVDDAIEEVSGAERTLVRTGCITKLLTTRLVQSAVINGQFTFNTEISTLLPRRSSSACGGVGFFPGIAVKHLIEHTHGLDDSTLQSAPKTADDFIDTEALCTCLEQVPRLAEPGQWYSYSNAGAWICAAILEHAYGARYVELLHRNALLGSHAWTDLDLAALSSSCCPANGGRLTLFATDVLEFLRGHFASSEGSPFAAESPAIRDEIIALPGWSPLERGVRLGWKSTGDGWFGHSSVLPGAAAFVRIHPRNEIGLLIASRDHAPTVVAANVFGRALPEFSTLRVPKPLTEDEAARHNLERYVGVYRNAASTISVEMTSTGTLTIRVDDTREPLHSKRMFETSLHPAHNNVFLSRPPEKSFPFVQFLLEQSGRSSHLWNGQRIWKNSCR
jgi:hypothetical protein